MDSAAAKIIIITLAVIGAFVLLSTVGMLFMHTSMLGGAPFHGTWTSMVNLCRGMMGA